jgi:tetratricopeptide (TPR) repeat protein/O-antigen ligase
MSNSSKLSVFCEKLIEAGWLTALIMAPLFFDVYSSRVFEPDKISLIRTIAIILIVAWFLRWLDQWRLLTRTQNAAATPGAVVRIRTRLGEWHRSNPLTLPTLLLIVSYLISTLASVSPSVTFLGSYQRLEGTYTTFSYIVIFFLAASQIRTRAQVDRAINLAILVSVPIALYGVIQHYYLDPLPWGGDVTARVASNMGNAIFVGAFLILVVPMVVARLIEQAQRAGEELSRPGQRLAVYSAAALSVVAIFLAWGFSFDTGARVLLERGGFGGTPTPELLAIASSNFNAALALSAAIVLGWWLVAFILNRRASVFLLIGLYALVLALQLITLVFTQSRGPQLGILAGLFAFAVLYSLARRAHKVALTAVVVAALGLGFLVIFNTASAEPIASLRSNKYIGRLGKVFDTNDGTNKVRSLIWDGALELVLPHTPLWSPTTGDDSLNLIRPLIGYGPESMYVAYNMFYPPDLAHVESRNASPDRSHNETFDSLVSTGLIGFVAYIILFLAIFYYALKWLGFISTPRQRNIFVGLWLGSAAITTIVFGLVIGWNFIGVAMPAGMMVGLLLYLTGFAILGRSDITSGDPARTLWIIALLSAIVAHFIEINFGIAIVSTRTYFWFIAALLVVIGMNRVAGLGAGVTTSAKSQPGAAPAVPARTSPEAFARKVNSSSGTRKGTRRAESTRQTGRDLANRVDAMRRGAPETPPGGEVSSTPIVIWAFLCGLVFATMGFDYISTVYGGQGSPLQALWSALTQRPTTAGLQPSYAMLWLFVFTIVFAAAVGLGEWAGTVRLTLRDWAIALSLFLVLSLAIFSAFVLYHMLLLTADSTRAAQAIISTVPLFNAFMVIMMLVMASAMLFDLRLPSVWIGREWNWAFTPLLALGAALVIWVTNVEIINADILYKQGQSYDSQGQWENSIATYTQALQKQPTQDFYMLFLGRAYLESSKSVQDVNAREQRLQRAEKILLQAQAINPLNTDHTANLGRLHRAWMSYEQTQQAREEHFQKSFKYYTDTTHLSPNTAHLYNEFGELLLAHGDSQAALQNFDKSLALDDEFSQTRLILADWYRKAGDMNQAALQQVEALKLDPNAFANADGFPFTDQIDVFIKGGQAETATQLWLEALKKDPGSLNVHMELAETYRQLKRNDFARNQIDEATRLAPKSITVWTYAANYFSETGDLARASQAATTAMNLIPKQNTSDIQRYQGFISQLQQLSETVKTISQNPNDIEAHRRLGYLYFVRAQNDLALKEYQNVVALNSNDYNGWFSLGMMYIQLNQLASAGEALTKTLALAQPGDKEIVQLVQNAVQLALKGDKAAALAATNAALARIASTDQLARSAMTTLQASLQP